MDLLEVWDIYYPSDSIQLYDLNLALGRALAIVYWRGRQASSWISGIGYLFC